MHAYMYTTKHDMVLGFWLGHGSGLFIMRLTGPAWTGSAGRLGWLAKLSWAGWAGWLDG